MDISTIYVLLMASVFIAAMVWNIVDKRKKIIENREPIWMKYFSILSSGIVILAIIYVVLSILMGG